MPIKRRLKPGKQIKGDKKVSTIHVVVPEDKKHQVRKSLKTIYPINPRQNYPEKIQWHAIEIILDRDVTVIEQSAIAAEREKIKQHSFL